MRPDVQSRADARRVPHQFTTGDDGTSEIDPDQIVGEVQQNDPGDDSQQRFVAYVARASHAAQEGG